MLPVIRPEAADPGRGEEAARRATEGNQKTQQSGVCFCVKPFEAPIFIESLSSRFNKLRYAYFLQFHTMRSNGYDLKQFH